MDYCPCAACTKAASTYLNSVVLPHTALVTALFLLPCSSSINNGTELRRAASEAEALHADLFEAIDLAEAGFFREGTEMLLDAAKITPPSASCLAPILSIAVRRADWLSLSSELVDEIYTVLKEQNFPCTS